MLQLRFNNHQPQPHIDNSNVIEAAITNALSMNYPNASGSMALSVQTANALNLKSTNLNNNLETYAKSTSSGTTPTTITQIRHTNGSISSIVNSNLNSSAINNQNDSSPTSSKKMLKKSHNERKYPCGFPGCHWIFTRSNHVVRHQRRIHGLNIGLKTDKLDDNNNNMPKPSVSNQRSRIMNNLSSNGISIVRNQTQINQQLMHRRMNIKEDFSRMNQLVNRRLSKNSLLLNNQMCNDNNLINNVSNLSSSRQTAYKLLNQNQLKQQNQVKHIGNIRRFQCNVDNCGQKFCSEMLFNNHLKVRHNVDRSLINKSVNLGGLNNHQQPQNKSLNNLNNVKNLNNQQSNSLSNHHHLNNNAKTVKNLNSLNNQIKLFLSNKTNNSDNSDALSSYISNLKMLQTTKPTNNLIANNVDQLVTKVNSSISLPQKMYVPVSALNNLNLDQHNKQFLIAHTKIDLPNDNQPKERIQIQPPPTTRILFQCEITNCYKRFNRKENLVDHLFDDHKVFEPEIIVNLDNSDNSDDWLSLDDPKNKPLEEFELLNQALVKPSKLTKLKQEDDEDCRPSKVARSFNEPSLATTLGIVNDVVTKIDNVNILNNISATSTYSNLNKSHVCNINNCTKSFNKRYHLVRHRLEAHQVGRLSLMEDIVNEKHHQQQQNDLKNNKNNSKPLIVNTILIDKKDEKVDQQNQSTPKVSTISVAPTIVTTIATYAPTTNNVTNNNSTVPSTFYIRRPPQDFRPYPCKFPNCGWSFKRSYHLKRHQKLHQNTKTPITNNNDNNEDNNNDNEDSEEIIDSEQAFKQEKEEAENVIDNAIESSSTSSDQTENKVHEPQQQQLVRTRRLSLRSDDVQMNGIVKKEEEKEEESEKPLKEEENSDKQPVNKPIAKRIITRLSTVKKEEEEVQDDEEEEIEEEEEEDSTSQSQLESDDKSSSDKPLKMIKNNKRIETRKISTRQVKQETTTTDEENSCDVSNNNQQSIQCEFSFCNKRFTRQRQYDLHVKVHLQEKQKVQMDRNRRTKTDQNVSQDLPANKNCITNSNKLNGQDNSSEELYTVAETSTANTRSSRARRSDLQLDNKMIDSQQLLLLCNPKDMIFINQNNNNESLKAKKDKKAFICEVDNCMKKFGRNCELTRHMKNHLDFWPYVCAYANCNKKFKRKDVYKNHQRTHLKNGDKMIDS